MEDLKNFTAFAQLARSGSFTAAAGELGMSTAAVSKIISRLERRLATRLFTRSTRRLSLTAEGRLFLEKVDIMLAQMSEAMDVLHAAQHEPSGVLRLWANVAIGKDYVLPMLAEFLSRYPKVCLEVRLDDHVPNLIASGYDVAIHHTALGSGTNVVKRLTELPLALVASAKYVAQHGTPTSPQDLANHQCIVTRSTALPATVWEFRPRASRKARSESVRVEPKGRVVIAEQYDGVLNAALCGMGVTVMFAQSALRYLKSRELKVLLPNWRPHGGTIESNNVYLWYPHRTYVPYNARVLVDFLTARFHEPAQFAFDPYEWVST